MVRCGPDAALLIDIPSCTWLRQCAEPYYLSWWPGFSAAAGMAKTTGATFGGNKFIHHFKGGLHHRYQHQLGQTFAHINGEALLATVPAADHQLTLIVRVNQANQIAQHNTVFMP